MGGIGQRSMQGPQSSILLPLPLLPAVAWVREHWPLGPELRVLRQRPQGPLSRKPSQSWLRECQKKKSCKTRKAWELQNLAAARGTPTQHPGPAL